MGRTMAAIFTKQSGIRAVSVGADAYIGPLGSHGFAVDSRKNRCGLRADRVVRPYGVQGAAKPCCRGRRLCRPVWVVTNSPKSSVKTDCSARADVGIGPYNEIWWCTRGCIGLCFSPLPAATPQALRASSPFRGAVILLFPPRPFPAAAYRRRRSGRRRRSPVPRRTRPAGGKGR